MLKNLIVPKNYSPILDLQTTEKAIKIVKDGFEQGLSSELRLKRVTAPLFVLKDTGINDDLNGVELKVSFAVKDMGNQTAEVVNSLAKWKRMVLADYKMNNGYGIYADMNAIRPDEVLDNLHSLYVDQWDWELAIRPEDRNLAYLKYVVRKIFEVMKRTEYIVFENYPEIIPILPQEITFLQSEDLLMAYPGLDQKQREDEACKKHGAIFVIGIGGPLSNGEKHDGRAPDYDDWITETGNGYRGLNGDLVVWNPVLERSFEISSMGIRVDRDALLQQLEISGQTFRKNLYWHKRLLAGEFPLSIGGGIGQSRLCMYYLRKAHVGEVQSSIWDDETIETCRQHSIPLM
jgi:aspartate--ammonia ligase